MEQIINELNDLLDASVYSTRDSFSKIMDGLASHWHLFTEAKKEEIAEIIIKTDKNYLGDVKWVLYQYICDMKSDDLISIRCGNFAFNKLAQNNKNAIDDDICEVINLNGEEVLIYHVSELNKKQLIISKHNFKKDVPHGPYCAKLKDVTIYPDDIVLYFA